ncbi:cobaltochelatase subunit CobN [Colwellia sp. 1_MG-2023]|uniref:cobaltochelatase subunit CobN n=1 Tax=unclassified Colwellia TaxID=196834 RepID=UPI001C0A0B34|nr:MULTISPECIES: cobaltochelatase subunit CobN [unclassified Colwellia]MBU2923569.1 cobaltochelatase subunit CobN [Colwellia sp. C2M11]MDO6653256.1 cobaltochelatase subunit CobN [Colwellia sp. 3_MG-2023]MDO6664499.1 cobaltochelatase subunit CobN [Colwellia sp. 2_MG-2023]MDO6688850.1 cobaltochelatase subunit CobN [Colwellia sp. 1_MG-2023]
MMRILLTLLLFVTANTVLASASAGSLKTVLVIASDFVAADKFTQLALIGKDYSIKVEYVNAQNAGRLPNKIINNASLVILDGPRPSDRDAVEAVLSEGTAGLTVPWIQVGGGRPRFGLLPANFARSFIGYYANGTTQNYQYLFSAVEKLATGESQIILPEPLQLTKQGVYTPNAVFGSLAEFLASDMSLKNAPLIGFVISNSLIRDMQTTLLDDLYIRTKKAGLTPVFMWFDSTDANGLSTFWQHTKPSAMVNMTHMQNGEARKAEFLQLNVPVLQAFTYRNGSKEEWLSSPEGLSANTTATLMAVPESWGMTDPLVIAAIENGEAKLINEQVPLLLGKLKALTRLQTLANKDKKIALMFWNTPSGEENISASNLNIPTSLSFVINNLLAAGYQVETKTKDDIINQGKLLLSGLYHPEKLLDLWQKGMAISVSIDDYLAWFKRLPQPIQQEVTAKWGDPNSHSALRTVNDISAFIIPAASWGNLLVMPQPPRSGKIGADTHDTKVPPDHYYLAAYLALQLRQTDALIHFGTHGTQEWTPGKARGLSANDYPFLTLANIPVIYPYIQDNVTEALQARRRGRATTISHQTPSFAPSGLYKELLDIHGLVHEYELLSEGQVKNEVQGKLLTQAKSMSLDIELGFNDEQIQANFDNFYQALHDHLHALAATVTPLGLHTFGRSAESEHLLLTVLQQLGPDYLVAAGEDAEEFLATGIDKITQSRAMKLLKTAVIEHVLPEDNESLIAILKTAQINYKHLLDNHEMLALLQALNGEFIAAGLGGDPVRIPETTNGTNLYGFDPLKIPTSSAYKASEKMFTQLVESYNAEHQEYPDKLAFSLWSSEAQRHMGVVEGQVLRALGLQPVWGRNGRVSHFDIIPQEKLPYSRIDVVIQVTSVYRDQFDGFMGLLADAIARLAALDDGNIIARNAQATQTELMTKGIPQIKAKALAELRIFSNQPGDYGTGVTSLALDSTSWEGDGALAEQYLARLQYGYGRDGWGITASQDINLFGQQLKGVDAAIMSRSSNLHGMLSTDHPFEFLGGMAAAVRSINGKSPELYVSDLRQSTGRVVSAADFISEEMRGRYLNPNWITAMQGEGYAGALEILDTVNNIFGWQATAPDVIRHDQWEAISQVYVEDKYELGLNEWFDEQQPVAQMQIIERMAEAIRKDYWQASEQAKAALAIRYEQLLEQNPQHQVAIKTAEFLSELVGGYGLNAGESGGSTTVVGQTLQQVTEQPIQTSSNVIRLLIALVMLGLIIVGVIRQQRINQNRIKLIGSKK